MALPCLEFMLALHLLRFKVSAEGSLTASFRSATLDDLLRLAARSRLGTGARLACTRAETGRFEDVADLDLGRPPGP